MPRQLTGRSSARPAPRSGPASAASRAGCSPAGACASAVRSSCSRSPDRPMPGDGVPGLLVLAPDTEQERSTPVYDWLAVGRECPGVDERHRLLIEDPTISRTHVELWLDHDRDQAWLTDRSTNGTRLNGQRIERSVPTPIKPGDRIRLGDAELQFRSRRFTAA